jgi:AAA ATPase domain
MFLKRVQVPDFRALKNVDISFEPQFRPRVFPLGSQNGGGKSTLLQLIFVLLHCSGEQSRFPLIKNLLGDFKIRSDNIKHNFATIEILVEDHNSLVLNFDLHCKNDIENQFKESPSYNKFVPVSLDESELKYLDPEELKEVISQHEIDEAKRYRSEIVDFLAGRDLHYITSWRSEGNGIHRNYALICSSTGLSVSALREFLNKVSDLVFLAAPSTQVFLFLSAEHKKRLFSQSLDFKSENYYSALRRLMAKTPNLFTYDFSLVDLLLEAFREARDSDFRQKTESGHYGNAYDILLNKVNALLGVKRVNALGDLSGIRFSMEQDGQKVDLLPEDLSHGELKRLSIYMWLEHLQIKDAIVLMDEIEIALHPDWQYHIVGDLVEWGPTNQYILATHSYELCQALPPAHVKEIEPNRLPQAQPV